MPIRPEHLNPGDTLGIVAPASAPPDTKAIERAIETLRVLGFRLLLAPNVRKRCGFLAGNDRERAGDLMRMFQDQRVKAILCLRGGYGSARLLPLLDYRVIRANPKIFLGYSDVTSLHCALLKKANLVSFHGPMLLPDFVQEGVQRFVTPQFKEEDAARSAPVPGRSNVELSGLPGNTGALARSVLAAPGDGRTPPAKTDAVQKFAWQGVHRTLMEPSPAGSICQGYHRKSICILRGGTASGQLVGGNLSVLCTTLGTPYQPSFKNRILFLEDHSEAPYRFDRMLTHLLNAGVLQQVAGVAIGINRNCSDPNARKGGEYRQTLQDVLKERLVRVKVPVVTGLPFGHVSLNATLPIGVRATLDGNTGDLVITEAAVK
jgi:muramoyltetrapeptide carboxypeptidase